MTEKSKPVKPQPAGPRPENPQAGKRQPARAQPDNPQVNNPLHGKTLEMILNSLVEDLGWEKLAEKIRIRCFAKDPSVSSSLKFLRKTPWAREKVEGLYVMRERRKGRG